MFKKFRSEFKEFALKGNVIDLAVGVIIGGAFSTITASLVKDVIMPFVSMFIGGINFEEWKLTLPQLFGEPAADAVPITLNYGNIITTIINFIILALVIFLIIKGINKLRTVTEKKKDEVAMPASPVLSKDEVLLTEIRDILRDKK
ncbi:MAG: large-conductance mechanosensitive channel protein MscL [Clostridia bacterium]|nr:large-conductance mechanosensitive channel protein MscL [Clostridia bacterium]